MILTLHIMGSKVREPNPIPHVEQILIFEWSWLGVDLEMDTKRHYMIIEWERVASL